MSKLQEVMKAVETGKLKQIEELVQSAIDEGIEANEILNAMIETMGVIGDKFQRNEIFVPEMLVAGLTMKKGVEVLKPLLAGANVTSYGKFIIGTVQGDLHDIGKNLVGMMLEGAGFKVVDAGISVAPEKFVSLAQEHDAKIVGVSALLTTTMVSMRSVVEAVRAAGLSAKVIIGGAPVTQAFCDEIEADGYSPDAASAAELAKRLVGVQ